ncbi:MAG: ATP-binding protein [Pseudanabaenaceae cyanobacterium SKYGB_i_bin29]|nr:ATP-binding protein [Pseudanabaenaceae cyanobacterium SKYG29]MDW8421781.1 ATP-binding protein [Pseudanabaenaceae cyanobacterium SKYGB_i_bin29]
MWSGLLGLALLGTWVWLYWRSRRGIKAEERYRSIVENQQELIICWSTADNRITYANAATRKLFQCDKEPVENKSILDYIYSEDKEWVTQKISALSLLSPHVNIKCRIVLPDKQVRWQVWQLYLTTTQEVQGVGRDITEQVLIEETLEKFENRSRALIESIPDSIFIVNREGILLDIHSRLPLPSQPVVYPHISSFPCFLAISDRLLRLIKIVLTMQQIQTLEFSYPEGETYYEMRLVPTGEDEVTMIVRDVTDRKQAEAIQLALRQEQEINELQQHFFAMISHEFRTPLNVMAIAISSLENHEIIEQNPKLRRSIMRIKNASDRILATIDNIITIYQIKTNFFVPNWQVISINSLCQDVIEKLNIYNHQSINFYPEESNSSFISDPRLLSCILEQLLTNALKYSQSDVFIKAARQANTVEITVSDQGIGIPAGEVKHIFEPFFRGSNVQGIHGSGLGLSLVQKCVEICQGKIDVLSNPEGGTTFRLNFPLSPAL